MIIGKKNLKIDLFFIIEEGQFNLGNFDKALMMIELASLTGADAIEFQLAYAEDFYIKSDPGFEIYKKREFTDNQLETLVNHTKENRLEFIATCLSCRLVPKMAKMGASAFNINASDINNPLIIDAILATGLPFFVSTPLATEEEIDWVVNRINSSNPLSNYAILHGQHTMASGGESVSPGDTSLGYISHLYQKHNVPVGFIDHTSFDWMPAIAVSSGAKIITKHMTASNIYKGPDWQICLEPAQMKKSIQIAREIHSSMLITDKTLAKGEDLDKKIMRRSIVASRAIKSGELLSYENIAFKRPGIGVPLNLVDKIIGKKLLFSIEKDTALTFRMVHHDE